MIGVWVFIVPNALNSTNSSYFTNSTNATKSSEFLYVQLQFDRHSPFQFPNISFSQPSLSFVNLLSYMSFDTSSVDKLRGSIAMMNSTLVDISGVVTDKRSNATVLNMTSEFVVDVSYSINGSAFNMSTSDSLALSGTLVVYDNSTGSQRHFPLSLFITTDSMTNNTVHLVVIELSDVTTSIHDMSLLTSTDVNSADRFLFLQPTSTTYITLANEDLLLSAQRTLLDSAIERYKCKNS
jgi:hypothetical protein